MSYFREVIKPTVVGLAKDVPWAIEQNRYQRTRETRLRAARQEAEHLIHPLFPAAAKPGSPEAKQLVLVGANVTSHVVSEICDPDTQIFLNRILEPVHNWATGTGDLETVIAARQYFLRSGLYSDYFNINLKPNPATIEETKRMGQAVEFVDEMLFGTISLDSNGLEQLDRADKLGESLFKPGFLGIAGYNPETDQYTGMFGISLPDPATTVYSIAEMSMASHKAIISSGYNSMAAGTVASIARHMGAVAVGRFYGADAAWGEDNPLFQERINEIIKQTLNPQPQD